MAELIKEPLVAEELIVEAKHVPIEEVKPEELRDKELPEVAPNLRDGREDIFDVYKPVEMTTVTGETVMIKQIVESHSIERLYQRQAELIEELTKVNTLIAAIQGGKA